jgi:alkaline phosphatase D
MSMAFVGRVSDSVSVSSTPSLPLPPPAVRSSLSLGAALSAALLFLAACTNSTGRVSDAVPAATASDSVLTRIAFGSCNHQDRDQPLWPVIEAADPDLWIWLGDNIYADTEDMAVMDSMYARQRRVPGYRALRSRVPVIGTWDDHDYGANDAGRTFPRRDSSQALFLDFFEVPQDDPRRDRAGVYSAHMFGPPGRRVKVLLLDTRYHRDPITRDPISEQRYYPNPDGDILGDAQWAWLERHLRSSDAQIHLIGTSIQALARDHPWEKWANFPRARQRLLDVIQASGAPGVVLLSGDRHLSELSRVDDAIAYPLYDLTASGLTHHASFDREPNRYRVGPLIADLNFGLLEIDWEAEPVRLRFSIRGEEGRARLEHEIRLSDLQTDASG